MCSDQTVSAEDHFLKLIGKEDFNSLRADSTESFTTLDLEYFSLQVLNLESEYGAAVRAISLDSDRFYAEGQIEGTGIACDGDHFTEGDAAELRFFLKPEKIHRLRFAVAPFEGTNVSHIEFYEPSGNLLTRIENGCGWIDFQLPLKDREIASIARVSIYYRVSFLLPVLDSFELWQWERFQ